MKKLIVDLDDELKNRFMLNCVLRGKTQKEVIIGLIDGYLRTEDKKKSAGVSKR